MKFLKNSYEKAKWGQQAIAKACERFRKEMQELNKSKTGGVTMRSALLIIRIKWFFLNMS